MPAQAEPYVVPPRRLVHPPRFDSDGPAVVELMSGYGIELDTWQALVLDTFLGRDESGKRVSRIAAVSAPRQQGKSVLLQSMAMAGVLLLDVQKVIIAAQETKTAALAFEQLANMFTVHEDLRRSVNTIINGIGRQSINLKSGQQIQLFARNRASVRGQTCGLYLSDESQYLDAEAWASILPTMAAVKEPLACLFGTPNTRAADGAVWTQLHDNAWRPDPPAGSTWVEWSADPASDITDPAVWRSANPSWRVTEEAMRTEFEALTIDDFRRERGGVFSEFGGRPAFSAEAWLKAVSDDRPEPDVRPSGLGIDMSPTGAEVTVVACWKSVNDPTAHVELVAQLAEAGDLNGWADQIAKWAGRKIPVLIDAKSPALPLFHMLKERDVRVGLTGPADITAACGAAASDLLSGTLTHAGQARLDDAISNCRRRPVGDAGGWALDRRDGARPIAAAVSMVLARHAVRTTRQRTGRVTFA